MIRRSSMLKKSPPKRRTPRRRGMAVVVVLGLLAITLALSYSMMRAQSMTLLVERNVSRNTLAEDAADAALSLAIARIHESSWQGVDVPLRGDLGNHCSYEVTFTTGDSLLTASSPNYSDFPYRLTITAVGKAADPRDAQIEVRRTRTAVLSLRRRAIASAPSNWSLVQNHSIFQWGTGTSSIHVPFESKGNTCFLGQLRICPSYPSTTSSRQRYLYDLNQMRLAGLPDYRPLQSTVRLTSRTTSDNRALVESQLGLSTITDTTTSTSSPVSLPSSVSTYRLYAGGKSYTIPTIQSLYGSTISGRTLEADVATNPLGVFRSSGYLGLSNNVTIRGTVISTGTSDDLAIVGTNVELAPPKLPRLENDTSDRKLAAALVRDDLVIYSGSQSTVRGLAMVWDDFDLKGANSTSRFQLEGHLAASTVQFGGRADWLLSSTLWSIYQTLFNLQNTSPPGPTTIPYFPAYLEAAIGMTVEPTLTVEPNSDGVLDHWHDFSQPLFVPASGDSGLLWNLVRIEDGR